MIKHHPTGQESGGAWGASAPNAKKPLKEKELSKNNVTKN